MKNSEKTQTTTSNEVNLENVKVQVKKGKKELITKKAVNARHSLYKGTESMKQEEMKKFRSKIRRTLRSFVNQILGKDRSEEERTKSVKDFLSFYKKTWKINDFKIENFTQSKDDADLKDYKDLLVFVSSTLEK